MSSPDEANLAMTREADLALCRSALYEALALGFRPPARETSERLSTREGALALAAAAAVIDSDSVGGGGRPPIPAARARGEGMLAGSRSPEEGRGGGGDPAGPGAPPEMLADLAAALSGSAGPASPDRLAESYRRLFGHTVRGEVPAYETEYGDDTLFQKPQEMSDIAGFFAAFGLKLDPASHERVDHVSCELEFLAFLCRKEAHASETGDEVMLAGTRKAIRLFLKDHLARFAPSLSRRLERADAGGFYGRLASLLRLFVRLECERLRVSCGPEMLRLRIDPDDGAPMACGTGDCAPGSCAPGHEEAAGAGEELLAISPGPDRIDRP